MQPALLLAAVTAMAIAVAAVLRFRKKQSPRESTAVKLMFERDPVLDPPVEPDRFVLRVSNLGDTSLQFSRDLILGVEVKTLERRLMPATVTSVSFPFELGPHATVRFEIEVDEMARVFKNIPESGVFQVSCLIFDLDARKYRSPSAPVSTYEMAARRETVEHLLSIDMPPESAGWEVES